MKVLLISPTFGPRTGGLETYLSHLACQLARLGHQVVLLTNRDDETQPVTETRDGICIWRTSALLETSGLRHTRCPIRCCPLPYSICAFACPSIRLARKISRYCLLPRNRSVSRQAWQGEDPVHFAELSGQTIRCRKRGICRSSPLLRYRL